MLTRGPHRDKLEILQYSAAGVHVYLYRVHVHVDEGQQARELILGKHLSRSIHLKLNVQYLQLKGGSLFSFSIVCICLSVCKYVSRLKKPFDLLWRRSPWAIRKIVLFWFFDISITMMW